MAWDQVLTSLPSLIEAGGTLMNLFTKRKASKEVPALNELLAATRGQQQYAEAAGNPNHPFFKNLVALNAEDNLAKASAGLRELLVQHRRALARGNPGVLVNPERRDEAVASAFMRGLYNQNEDAKMRARDYLMATSQGLEASVRGYNAAMPMQQAYSQIGVEQRHAAPGALADLFREGIKIYNQYRPPAQTFSGARTFSGNFGAGSYGQFGSSAYPINWNR